MWIKFLILFLKAVAGALYEERLEEGFTGLGRPGLEENQR